MADCGDSKGVARNRLALPGESNARKLISTYRQEALDSIELSKLTGLGEGGHCTLGGFLRCVRLLSGWSLLSN